MNNIDEYLKRVHLRLNDMCKQITELDLAFIQARKAFEELHLSVQDLHRSVEREKNVSETTK